MHDWNEDHPFLDRFEQMLQQDMHLVAERQPRQKSLRDAQACERQLDETPYMYPVPPPVVTEQGIPFMRGRLFNL
jgi:hypothetical protein